MRNHAVPQQPANGVVVCRVIPEAWFVVARFRLFVPTAVLYFCCDSRHHPRPDPRRWRQHAVILHQMPPRPRHQRTQSLHHRCGP
jgi:hypothetical protein